MAYSEKILDHYENPVDSEQLVAAKANDAAKKNIGKSLT